MRDGLKDEHREAIIDEIAANDRVERAVLFGSRATGTNTVSSDVDIVLFGDRLTLTDQARLIAALDEIPMAQSIDLILYDSIRDRTLQEHIWNDGIEWFTRVTHEEVYDHSRVSRSLGVGDDWSRSTLGEVVTLQRGFDLPRSQRKPGDYSVIASTGPVGRHNEAKVSGPGVVIGRSGSIGGGQFIEEDFWPLNTTLWVKNFNDNDPRFCYYFLKSLDLAQFDAGSGVPTLNRNHIHSLPAIVPPPSEQRTISHVLGTLDDKIELNRRMNKTLEAMARALFKSWFIDFDPVRAKMEGRETGIPKDIADLFPDRLVNSEIGEVPEGWEVVPLDAIARFQNGLALQKYRPVQNEARLPVVKIAQLRTGEASTTEWARATIRPECIIENGDVLFSWSGSLLVKTWCGGRAALNQHLFKVTSERYPKWFYLHSLLSHLSAFQRIARNKATTMGHIRRHHLTDALCVVPPNGVIPGVSDTFACLLNQQVANELVSRTLTTLRDTLLPKLISGELRVKQPETERRD